MFLTYVHIEAYNHQIETIFSFNIIETWRTYFWNWLLFESDDILNPNYGHHAFWIQVFFFKIAVRGFFTSLRTMSSNYFWRSIVIVVHRPSCTSDSSTERISTHLRSLMSFDFFADSLLYSFGSLVLSRSSLPTFWDKHILFLNLKGFW